MNMNIIGIQYQQGQREFVLSVSARLPNFSNKDEPVAIISWT